MILAPSEPSFSAIAELLRSYSIYDVIYSRSAGEGRRLLLEKDFDLVFINSPLPDENGEDLARHVASQGLCQVILAVKSEIYPAVTAVCEGDGVFTLAKPISPESLRQIISLARTVRSRLANFQVENEGLKQKIEDILIIDRAKNILISSARMSEQEAHRYIEKKAMDQRISKRQVSEGIIHDYEHD
ncbi:MAG: ANTAR domain-containing protein [Treponema sp.]|nr:ANTAR domain-containing protein [Treponema sp.]